LSAVTLKAGGADSKVRHRRDRCARPPGRCCVKSNRSCIVHNMPAKEILAAVRELEAAGWRVQITSGRAHAYARAYCPGDPEGCPPLTIYGTPRVPQHEAAKIVRALGRCEHHGGKGSPA